MPELPGAAPEATQPQGDGRRRLLRIASVALIVLAAVHYAATNEVAALRLAQIAVQTVLALLAKWLVFVLSYPLSSKHPIYWVYVASSFAVAFGVYLFVRRGERLAGEAPRRGLGDFVRFCFPRAIWKNPSAWLDVRFCIVDALLLGLCGPVVAVVSGAAIAAQTKDVVAGLFTAPPLAAAAGTLPAAVAFTIFVVMLGDLFAWVAHFLQHKVRFLWEFHKVHHSASVLHPLTAYRQHPVDTIMNAWSYALAAGLGTGVAAALFGFSPRLVQVMGVSFVLFSFNVAFANLRHSHVWLAWPPALGRIFGGPANHQIHHSAETRHLDKNFCAIFALWDWMFGTLYLPRERESFRMGLADGTQTEYDSVLRLYGLPFVKIFRSATNGSRTGGAPG